MAREFVRTNNSVGQYIACGNAASLNPANNLSLACWIYPTTSASGRTVHFYFTRDSGNNINRCYSLLRQAASAPINTIECSIFKTDTSSTNVKGTTVTNNNTWYHIALTYEFVTDGTSILRLYVNGAQEGVSTTAVGPIQQAAQTTEIGRRAGTTQNFPANARIADAGIWNHTLTAGEGASLAAGMSCDKVRPQGLVLYAPLVRDLIDLKGNTLTNNGTTVANHPRVYA